MNIRAAVHRKGTFSLGDLLKQAKRVDDFSKAGAMALFVGVARGETLNGEKVQKLTLEAFEEKANQVLLDICDTLSKKPGIVDVQIHHLLGDFVVGEDLVYVLVSGGHRNEVYPVLEEAVERYKTEAPIFKKEYFIDAKGDAVGYWVSEKGHE